jgi:hypothetical protein
MVGEFVEAGVGHQHGVIAEVLGQIPQRNVEDAVLGHAHRSGRVLVGLARHPEQHQPADTRAHRVGRRVAQRVAGVLYDAGHRCDGARLVDAVGDEHRQDQLPWLQRGFRHEPPQRRRRPEPAGAMARK